MLAGTERLILQVCTLLEESDASPITDARIARETQLSLSLVRLHLQVLASRGFLELVQTDDGFTVRVSPKGRQALSSLEPFPSIPEVSPPVRVTPPTTDDESTVTAVPPASISPGRIAPPTSLPSGYFEPDDTMYPGGPATLGSTRPGRPSAKTPEDAAPASESANAERYNLWYGTNRKPVNPGRISQGYTGLDDERLHYGTCVVSIPKSHKVGSVGSPWWLRWLRRTDDRLKLIGLEGMSDAKFWARLRKASPSCLPIIRRRSFSSTAST